jgi:hypothetical protein
VLGAGNLPGRAEGIKVDSHGREDSSFCCFAKDVVAWNPTFVFRGNRCVLAPNMVK